jgi:hypothetical protein
MFDDFDLDIQKIGIDNFSPHSNCCGGGGGPLTAGCTHTCNPSCRRDECTDALTCSCNFTSCGVICSAVMFCP